MFSSNPRYEIASEIKSLTCDGICGGYTIFPSGCSYLEVELSNQTRDQISGGTNQRRSGEPQPRGPDAGQSEVRRQVRDRADISPSSTACPSTSGLCIHDDTCVCRTSALGAPGQRLGFRTSRSDRPMNRPYSTDTPKGCRQVIPYLARCTFAY